MMKKTKTSSRPKTLQFLDQCRIDCKKYGASFSPAKWETAHKVGHGRFGAAVTAGYFERNGQNRWVCKVDEFTMDMVDKVIELHETYLLTKAAEREQRGHVPIPRKPDQTSPEQIAAKQAEQVEQAVINYPTEPVEKPKPVIPLQPDVARASVMDHFKSLPVEQFLNEFKSSAWVAECKRRGFNVHITFATKIDL